MRKLTSTSALFLLTALIATNNISSAGNSVHMTYLWHMQQPIYWPADSLIDNRTYQRAYESMTDSGDPDHPQNDLAAIFGKDDRVDAYQYSPKNAISSALDLPNMGASLNYPGDLVENIKSLADNGWTYSPQWYSATREAHGWQTSGGHPRLDIVNFSAHHIIPGLVPQEALKKDILVHQYLVNEYLLANPQGTKFGGGYFPTETCFSERCIKTLVECGIDWTFVANIHLSRACENYENTASGNNNNPPNKADMTNPAQSDWFSRSISRGCTPKNAVPFAYQPHYAKYVDPNSGIEYKIIVVPTAQAMGWEDGYACYGTSDMETIAGMASGTPMIAVLAHDGDNAFGGGWSYYNECVTNLTHSAAAIGVEPLTVDQYLQDHPVDLNDIVKVEDGGWVNADADFGAPRYINWLWPPMNYDTGKIDVINGWSEDFRNWAVITAGVNRVKTAEDLSGGVRISRVADPTAFPDATESELAWHKLLPAMTSGYMYYGTSLDMEVKPSVACNAAVSHADSIIGSTDNTPPTIFVPQRQPYNPGGYGNGALWGWQLTPMDRDFYVWTFSYDVSGLQSATLKYRVDADGVNPLSDNENETYTGGTGVGQWQSIAMTKRDGSSFVGNIYNDPSINFDIMPQYIADEYYAQITGFSNTLLDYYVEATDEKGNTAKSDIQHVWVGDLSGNGGGEYESNYGTVHVPGDSTAVFGSSWNPNGADNEMTLVADYTWRWIRSVSSATSVEYKVAMNGSWSANRGLGNSSGLDLTQDNWNLSQDGANIHANLPAAICVWEYYENTETSKLYVMPADLYIDGGVDFADYAVLAGRWMDEGCTGPGFCDGADLNKSGSVDWYDLTEFVKFWLLDTSP